MTQKTKDQILTSYKWIKVKRLVFDSEDSDKEKLEKLEKHHLEETTFLIDFIRNLVKDLPVS